MVHVSVFVCFTNCCALGQVVVNAMSVRFFCDLRKGSYKNKICALCTEQRSNQERLESPETFPHELFFAKQRFTAEGWHNTNSAATRSGFPTFPNCRTTTNNRKGVSNTIRWLFLHYDSCLSAASSREHFFSQCVTTWSDPPGTMC